MILRQMGEADGGLNFPQYLFARSRQSRCPIWDWVSHLFPSRMRFSPSDSRDIDLLTLPDSRGNRRRGGQGARARERLYEDKRPRDQLGSTTGMGGTSIFVALQPPGHDPMISKRPPTSKQHDAPYRIGGTAPYRAVRRGGSRWRRVDL